MVKYRPSKSFACIILPSAALVISLGFGLLPELKEFEARPIPGEITFSHEKPEANRNTLVSAQKNASFGGAMDWLEESSGNLMRWKHNPWKPKSYEFGDHFTKLCESKNPMDQAKVLEIRRMVDVWHQKLLLRFPELAVEMKSVPDEQNGFLKWLDLMDKIKAANPDGVATIVFPKALDDYLNHEGEWNADASKAWLSQNQSLVDEIHAIGLLPEHSIKGIPIERWGYLSARFAKNCGEILMLQARVAAESGDVAAALETVRAARGLADHFSKVETASLMASSVNMVLQFNLQSHVLYDIIPALPADKVDPAAWESALNPAISSPAEYARVMKGEWSVMCRYYLLPVLLDAEDPKSPPDSGEFLDFSSLYFLKVVRDHENAALSDLPKFEIPQIANSSHLSRLSREAVARTYIGARAWRNGWDRAQSQFAMTQAAFAIMKGQPIRQDPVYGVDYRWDAATRQVSMPAGKSFDDLGIKPITVPKL